MEIILGTYESFLVGYKVTKEEEKKGYQLTQSFTNNAHCDSIRCLAVSGQYLASGGADENIKLCDLTQRVEHGALVHHSGTVTCLEFHHDTHLLSGSEDGSICIWSFHNKTWHHEKTLTGHKSSVGGVTSLAVHPSGRLALSCGRDFTIRTWDLVKGRCAHVLNLKGVESSAPEWIRWSPDGNTYAVAQGVFVKVYCTQTAGVKCSIEFGRRVNCIEYISDNLLAIGGESPAIQIRNLQSKEHTSFTAHETRTRALRCTPSPSSGTPWLLSASTDGLLKVWEIVVSRTEIACKEVMSTGTACRITSMAVWLPSDEKELPRKPSQKRASADSLPTVTTKSPGVSPTKRKKHTKKQSLEKCTSVQK